LPASKKRKEGYLGKIGESSGVLNLSRVKNKAVDHSKMVMKEQVPRYEIKKMGTEEFIDLFNDDTLMTEN
jgi:hypothetical protein